VDCAAKRCSTAALSRALPGSQNSRNLNDVHDWMKHLHCFLCTDSILLQVSSLRVLWLFVSVAMASSQQELVDALKWIEDRIRTLDINALIEDDEAYTLVKATFSSLGTICRYAKRQTSTQTRSGTAASGSVAGTANHTSDATSSHGTWRMPLRSQPRVQVASPPPAPVQVASPPPAPVQVASPPPAPVQVASPPPAPVAVERCVWVTPKGRCRVSVCRNSRTANPDGLHCITHLRMLQQATSSRRV
jgi:hypothetical protein